MRAVGRSLPRPDAPEKATGKARYIQDLRLPGMLHGAIRRSPIPHGRIVSIDVAGALAVPGVRAVITGRDLPARRFGFAKDRGPLCRETVRWVGDEVAAVAADDPDAAREAVERIRVEIEPLPAVLDVEKSTDVFKEYAYEHGDFDRELSRADAVVEGEFRTPAQAHGCLAPGGVVAEWDARGRLTLHDPTQVPFLVQRDVAEALGIPPADVRIVQPTLGGGFGSRLDLYPHELIAALLARRTGRPVRVLFSRGEDFATDPVRPRTILRLRTAASKDGTLRARSADVLVDAGAYVSWGSVTPVVQMHTFGCLWRVPAARFRAKVAYTNTAPTGAMRGFGNPEITFAMESQMDELAAKLGIDPVEFRRRNMNRPGETTPQGSKITSCGMEECLAAAEGRIGWREKRGDAAWRRPAAHLRRGIGFAGVFHVGGGARVYRSDGSGASVKVDDYGRVTILAGATEAGQGMEGVLSQIAAEELGVPFESVRVASADTDARLWDVGAHASRTTFIAGNAVRRAAADVRRQIEEARTSLGLPPGTPIDKVVRAMHFRDGGRVVAAQAFYDPPNEMLDAAGHGNVSATYAFGAHAAEVEVDTETGRARVLRIVAAHDVGRAINPAAVEGQIEGGVVQGLGFALAEEVRLAGGRFENASFTDYRMPGPRDVPEIVPVIVESNDPEGPFGAKGVGELGVIPVAPAVANAIADAVGVRLRELPMTPERVLRALDRAAPPT